MKNISLWIFIVLWFVGVSKVMAMEEKVSESSSPSTLSS